MSLYSFGVKIAKLTIKPYYRLQVCGIEHIPEEGGVLLCANHISNVDPIVLGVTASRPISFMAKSELFEVPVLKHILPKLNAFPVKRGLSDRGALRNGLATLKEGNVLGLFPEGTRSKTGKLQKGLAGAGFFALRTEAKVVPCAIIGPYKLFGKVKVIYGEPLDMTELRENKGSAEDATTLIMEQISNLITENEQ